MVAPCSRLDGRRTPRSSPRVAPTAHHGDVVEGERRRRSVALDQATVAALRQHRTRQLAERLAAGEAYEDGDLVVCLAGGTPVHPKTLSYYFEREVRRAGLPPIRLHDLRHTHATLALRAGVHPQVVQERLGHANVSITLDTYSHVDLDMQAAAAGRVAALVAGADQ
jgi:integrase